MDCFLVWEQCTSTTLAQHYIIYCDHDVCNKINSKKKHLPTGHRLVSPVVRLSRYFYHITISHYCDNEIMTAHFTATEGLKPIKKRRFETKNGSMAASQWTRLIFPHRSLWRIMRLDLCRFQCLSG